MDRKTFINFFARGGILALMALLGGVLLFRKQISLEQECGENFQCRKCTKLKRCQLPEAEKERGNEKG